MSILNVNKINPVGGGSTITIAGIASVTGNVTATGTITGEHHGDGANLTGLPAANLTGTLPALNAANLTSIPAANLTGTVADARISALSASKLTGALPAISGASLTGISAGITEYDEWRITSSLSTSTATLTANWERNDTSFEKIGTGMSESSGIFTFPSTGKWRITFVAQGQRDEAQFFGTTIYYSSNSGSDYYYVTYGRDSNSDATSNTWCQALCSGTLDVTDVSTFRVKFVVDLYGTWSVKGNSTYNDTWASFTKLGET